MKYSEPPPLHLLPFEPLDTRWFPDPPHALPPPSVFRGQWMACLLFVQIDRASFYSFFFFFRPSVYEFYDDPQRADSLFRFFVPPCDVHEWYLPPLRTKVFSVPRHGELSTKAGRDSLLRPPYTTFPLHAGVLEIFMPVRPGSTWPFPPPLPFSSRCGSFVQCSRGLRVLIRPLRFLTPILPFSTTITCLLVLILNAI